MNKELKKPLALITGGTSGIGFALAMQLAIEGYELIILGRNQSKLDDAVAKIKIINPSVIGFSVDVSREDSFKKVIYFLSEHNKKIHFLIMAAGIGGFAMFEESSISSLYEITVNDLWGTILPTKLFLPFIPRNEDAYILLISSISGLIGSAGYTIHSATKAGVINFAQALRRELLDSINIHVAIPVYVDTPLFQQDKNSWPNWLKKPALNLKPVPVKFAAQKFLKKCRDGKFLIIIDRDVNFICNIVERFLPRSISQWVYDKLTPSPPKNNYNQGANNEIKH